MSRKKQRSKAFVWVPMHERKDRLGLPLPPRKADPRTAVFWLARDGDDLYFVNNSEETLAQVVAISGGFFTADDEPAAVGGANLAYDDVKPGEAILIDTYDPFLDCDFMLGVTVYVRSTQYGDLTLVSPNDKGGIGEWVLLWDTGEAGKYVQKSVADSDIFRNT